MSVRYAGVAGFALLALAAPPATANDAHERVLCVAGCDSKVPVVVQTRPNVPPPPPTSRSKWEQVSWGVWCSDTDGCRAVGNVPTRRHSTHTHTSTIYVYHRSW